MLRVAERPCCASLKPFEDSGAGRSPLGSLSEDAPLKSQEGVRGGSNDPQQSTAPPPRICAWRKTVKTSAPAACHKVPDG